MSKHTPGPWTVTRVSKSTILKDIYISASPERIARVCVPSTAQSIAEYEANARLLALAPEMLDALDAALEWAAPMGEAPRSSRPEWYDIARALVAKAQN